MTKRKTEEEVQPHFSTIITTPSHQLRKLRLPSEFTEEIGSTLSGYAYLRTSKVKKHKVTLSKKDGNLWFKHGWSDFCRLHSLADGHCVVFYYQGNSRFNVSIFTEDDTTDEEDGTTDEEDDTADEEDDISTPVSVVGAYERAEAFKSDKPRFIITMHRSYIICESRMWIPKLHAMRYIGDEKSEVQLRKGGGLWSVGLTRSGKSLRLCSGWRAFVLGNDLEVDDVCVFELIDANALVYKVHIFRD